jgi:hypothetical protein
MLLPHIVDVSADGHTLVAGGSTLMVFDLDRQELLWKHDHFVRNLAVSADGSRIAVVNSGLVVFDRSGKRVYEDVGPGGLEVVETKD